MNKSNALILFIALSLIVGLAGCSGTKPVIGKSEAKYFNPLEDLPKWVSEPEIDDALAVSAVAPYCHAGISCQIDILDAEAYQKLAMHTEAIIISTVDMLRETHQVANIEASKQTVKKLIALEIPAVSLPRIQRSKWFFNENTGDLWALYFVTDEALKDAFRLSLLKAGAEKQFIEEGVAYLDKNILQMKNNMIMQNKLADMEKRLARIETQPPVVIAGPQTVPPTEESEHQQGKIETFDLQ